MKKEKINSIIFETTRRCNQDCLYCYNYWKADTDNQVKENEYYAMKTLKKLMKQCDFDSITFSGGEPLLHPGLFELIYQSKIHHKRVNLITNGSSCNKETMEQYLSLGIDWVELTLNSYRRNIHDQMVLLEGSYEKVIEMITFVIKMGTEVVPVIVITKHNWMDVEETLRLFHSFGVSRVMMNRYNIGGKGVHAPDELLASKEQLLHAFSIADQLSRELNLIIYASVCSPICLLDPLRYPHIRFSHCGGSAVDQITIDYMGNVRYCNHSPRAVGNIFRESIRSIMKAPYLQEWKSTVPDYCVNCNLFSKCRGGCRAASEQLKRGLKDADPIIEYYQK